jgi:anti-anti-sigma factor
MSVSKRVSRGSPALAVAEMLDIYAAPDLLAAMRSALNDSGDLVIDLGGALRMHSAALQVLVAAVHAAQAGGRSVRFEGVSAEMAAMWGLAGFDALLTMSESAGEAA